MAEPWLHNESIEVDVNALVDFAKRVDHEGTNNLTKSISEGVEPMMSVVVPFGGGVLKEGGLYGKWHGQAQKAAGLMLRDLVLGMSCLSNAAASIAGDYSSGDALSAATNDDVYDAFYPSDYKKSLKGRMDELANGGDQQGGDKGAPQGPPQNNGDSATDDRGSGQPDKHDDDAGKVIAKDKPGQYVIPGDDEGMANTPDAPKPDSPIILAPGAPGDHGSGSTGTVM